MGRGQANVLSEIPCLWIFRGRRFGDTVAAGRSGHIGYGICFRSGEERQQEGQKKHCDSHRAQR